MKKGDQIAVYSATKLYKLLLSQEAQAYIMAFLSFFALAFFTIFAIRPTLISFFTLRKQIADTREVNNQLDAKIEDLLAAQKTYQEYRLELALLGLALPEDPQFVELIQKIETLADENNATINQFATQEVVLLNKQQLVPALSTLPATEQINFSLTTTAGFSDNELLLSHLLNLKRIISITKLDMSTAEETGSAISADITAQAYYLSKQHNDQ